MSQFRLPSIVELATLAIPGRQGDPFGWTGWLWSATPHPRRTNTAMAIRFSDGFVGNNYHAARTPIRLVLAGEYPAFSSIAENAPYRFSDLQDGTWLDRRTGLVWRTRTEPGLFTWSEAMAYAQSDAARVSPLMSLNWHAVGPSIQWGA